jgi:glycosyltransferase involved in cell wall biosynthesis
VSFYYHVLDLYLITSRIEGGPKQILESWASGVPVVSTKVGMVPDIATDRENVLLVEIEDIEEITKKTIQIIEDKDLKENLITNALKTVKKYDWKNIAKEYYDKIYSKLL